MAHDICIHNGRASMMYVGEPPWHGLGVQLKEPPTAEEGIVAAGLNWDVVKKPVFAHEAPPHEDLFHVRSKQPPPPLRASKFYAVVPTHRWGQPDCPVFGIVGGTYTPLQNMEAFAFFDPIIEMGAATYHTAGALGDGERVWVLAKLNDHIQIADGDTVDRYVLLSNSHDGQSSVQIKLTPIRVVCNNTLTQALERGPNFRITHLRDVRNRVMNAQFLLSDIQRRYTDLEKVFKEMAGFMLNKAKLDHYLSSVFPDPLDPRNEDAWERVSKDRALAEYFFTEGKGADIRGVRGTLWAAYNGVTEMVDHRKLIGKRERLLQSVWFGAGCNTKVKAFRIAQMKMEEWAGRS